MRRSCGDAPRAPPEVDGGVTMGSESADGPYLAGQLLIAMPGMPDPRFARSVIFMCAHNEDGAMGVVINKPFSSMDFEDLLKQVGVTPEVQAGTARVQFGGPVESQRGFVLHSTDYRTDKSVVIGDIVAVTSTLDVLQSIAEGGGPRRRVVVLGYAGWSPGQLDAEIQANGWLSAPADEAILFDDDLSTKWERAIAKIGISPYALSAEAGHA
jgi:putative transcriptional regulator